MRGSLQDRLIQLKGVWQALGESGAVWMNGEVQIMIGSLTNGNTELADTKPGLRGLFESKAVLQVNGNFLRPALFVVVDLW